MEIKPLYKNQAALQKNNQVVAARDHVGIKPLYMGLDPGNKRVFLSSELK